MPPTVEPLTNVDAAWLGMEDPTNLMMVSGVMTFDRPLNYERLKATIEKRLLRFGRFRQRVVVPSLPFAQPYWEDDPHFDLDSQLHRVALPGKADKKALEEFASDLLSTPLDFSKPLWQYHYVENYGEGSALIGRMHHCIADGMALMFVLLSITDMMREAPLVEPEEEVAAKEGRGGILGALAKQAAGVVSSARGLTGRVVQESLEVMFNPAKLVDIALGTTDSAMATGRLVLRTPDPQTIFKGKLGVAKRGTWTEPIPLQDIKAIKRVLGGTVNDVLVSAMTGSLRRYLLSRGEPVDGLNFRAAVPVNIRKPEEMTQMGNKFGLVFLSLPIGIEDPLERLAEVRKRMTSLKNTPEAHAAFGILNAIGASPTEIQSRVVDLFGSKATTVLTNVPGPPVPLYLAGGKIKDIMFWVPQSGRVSLGISIISYANKVWLGIATDAGLVPDPHTIVQGFYDEYEAMMAMVRQAEEIESQAETKTTTVAAETKTAAPQDDPDRCQATTKSGRQCRNRAQAGSDYCHLHQ